MAELFGREESNIRKHTINIFKEQELIYTNNVQNLHVDDVKQKVPFYDLDVIISVDYIVKYNYKIKLLIIKMMRN